MTCDYLSLVNQSVKTTLQALMQSPARYTQVGTSPSLCDIDPPGK
ncbi:hypothetical protein OHJ28_15930 [Dickeya fangzhongdai]